MNTELIFAIAICIIIATLVGAICSMFGKSVVFIAKSLIEKYAIIDFRLEMSIIVISTFIICIYFLI